VTARTDAPLRGRRGGLVTARTALAALLALDVLALAAEPLLARSVGQSPIAAAMLTAPASETAILGLGAVLARIAGHAILPAAVALVAAAALVRRVWPIAPR
jgi:hypothetical protein